MSEEMQSYAPTGAKGRLQLFGPESASLRICDTDLNELARGVGQINAQLDPGIYRAIAEMPGGRDERLVAVRPGQNVTVSDFKVEFDSVTPLWKASSHHEFHIAPAERLSGADHAGQGNSRLFIFARSLNGHLPSAPPRFQLWSQDNELVASFPESGESNLSQGWVALSVKLNSGTYFFRTEEPTLGVRNQAVYVDDNATTQFFAPLETVPVFSAAVVYMRLGLSTFDANAYSDYEVIDATLRGMANGEVILPSERLESFLHGKFENPLLGLIGGYALHRRRDFESLHLVAQNTLQMLPHSPDAQLLMMLAEISGGRLSDPRTAEVLSRYSFSVPPMFSVGTALLLRFAATNPDLVVAGSYLANVTPHLVVGSAWTRWSGEDSIDREDEQELERIVESSFTAGNWRLRSAKGIAQQAGLPHSVVTSVLERSSLFEERATSDGAMLYRRRPDPASAAQSEPPSSTSTV